ncbi:MAG: hypothetical protein NC218_07235 [Acetobacter sp.]|nr:hypothetical protein [Acetobacter sp.]
MKKAAYNNAVGELIKYGYLKLEAGTKTNFIFQEELDPEDEELRSALSNFC